MPHRPVMLGIVGDSAAGKTTITNGLVRLLGADRVSAISVDDYHKYNRAQRKALDITPLNPECNYIDIMEQHLRCLANGEPILKPVYNHSTGDFDPPEYIKPKQFMLVDGLLAFHTQKMREAFHVKVFLDPPEELRRQWKIKRDCAKRGYRPEEVLKELERREADSATYVRPQRSAADVVVRFYPARQPLDIQRLNVLLTLRSTLTHPDMSGIIVQDGKGISPLKLHVGREDGRLTEVVEIDGLTTPEQAATIEAAVWAQQPELQRLLPEQMGHFVEGFEVRQSLPLGLTQLLIAYHLLLARLQKDQQAREAQDQLLKSVRGGGQAGRRAGGQ